MPEDDPTKDLPGEPPAKEEMRVIDLGSFVDEVLSRLATIEQKLDERVMETRPIWERALAEIAETREEMAEFHQQMNAKFRSLDHKFDLVIKDLFDTRTNVSELESRVSDLERRKS